MLPKQGIYEPRVDACSKLHWNQDDRVGLKPMSHDDSYQVSGPNPRRSLASSTSVSSDSPAVRLKTRFSAVGLAIQFGPYSMGYTTSLHLVYRHFMTSNDHHAKYRDCSCCSLTTDEFYSFLIITQSNEISVLIDKLRED